MQKLDKIKTGTVPDQQVEVDPRSKTTADQAFNYIGTGKPELPVQGQNRMLARQEKKLKGVLMAWFSLAKIAMQAGAKIYSNRQKQKWRCRMHN